MVIRAGLQSDILKVSRLWVELVKELGPELTPNVEWWREHAEIYMRSGVYFVFVAEEGGRPVGFIDYFLFKEPATSKVHAVGQHFYVLPEYRKSKVSGQLWRKAMTHGKKNGAQIYELYCFEKELPFWKRHSFLPKRNLVRREIINHV